MADVELRVTADLDQATKELAGFSKEYAQLVKQVEKPLRQVNATRELEANLEATGKQVRQARQRLQELQRELINTDYPTTRLKESFREATKELQRLERAEATQANQLSRMRAELKGAGVDTTRLAQEQRRLNAELANALGAGRQDAAARSIRERAAALKQQAVAQRQANIEAARQDLGVNRFRALQAEIQRSTAQYEILRRSGKLTALELAVAQQQLTQRIRESRNAMAALAGSQKIAQGEASADGDLGAVVAGFAGGYGAASGLRAYVEITDLSKKMEAQLKLVTASQEEFNRAQEETYRIAQDNQAPMSDVVSLYSRLSPALRDIGRGQGDTLKIIEAVTMSLRISGATAQETASTIQQFSQALGSGVLRGEEFNAMAESSPRLLRAVADGLGVNVGALRAMAAEGKLTADVISDALIGQWDKLASEAEKIPDSVGGAMIRLSNDVQKAFGDGDTSGLIGAITKLRSILSDPTTVQGLSDLAVAMATLVGWTAQAAVEFTVLGKNIGYVAAQASGDIDALTKLEKTLEEVNNARTGNSFIGSNTTAMLLKWYDPKLLDEWAAELEQKIEVLRQNMNTIGAEANDDQKKLNVQRETEQERSIASESQSHGYREGLFAMHAAEMKALQQRAADDGKAIQEQQIKDTEAILKKQVAAERKAASELESAKKAQLETQQRYQEALAKVNGGVAGDPSYASATALKVSARNALQGGDVEGAKRQAQAALAVIEQLAAAGENTFGFGGFIKELQAIEQAADQKGIDSAQQKLEEAKKAAAATKAALEELKDVKVSATLSPEDEQKLLDQLQKLAEKAGIILTIPVTPVMPEPGELDSEGYAYVPNNPPPPQFATGGYTGPGGVYEPAGVVHRGEVVWSQLDIARAGGVAVVEAMRSGMRGYSMGGIVAAPRLMPSIPAISPSLMQQADPMSGLKDYGKATIATSGGDYEVLIRKDSFARLLQREADRVGSKKRR